MPPKVIAFQHTNTLNLSHPCRRATPTPHSPPFRSLMRLQLHHVTHHRPFHVYSTFFTPVGHSPIIMAPSPPFKCQNVCRSTPHAHDRALSLSHSGPQNPAGARHESPVFPRLPTAGTHPCRPDPHPHTGCLRR